MNKKTNIEINQQSSGNAVGTANADAPGQQTATKPAAASPPHAPKAPLTLMRNAVRKPGPSLKRQIRAQGDTDPLIRRPAEFMAPGSAAGLRIDERRLKRAAKISKSQLISRFSPPGQNEPHVTARTAAAMPLSSSVAGGNPAISRPAAARAGKPKTTSDILETAVQQATSHNQPPPKNTPGGRTKKSLGIGSAAALSVLVLGIVVSQNLPNVRLQMASAKAGFNAGQPAYRPAGFSLGQLNYSQGVVATQFRSNSDARSYTITQKRSSWDNLALLDNFVTPGYPHYQTIEAGGRTIYLYGGGNATWIKDGVWYVVQAKDSLTDRQLVELALSL